MNLAWIIFVLCQQRHKQYYVFSPFHRGKSQGKLKCLGPKQSSLNSAMMAQPQPLDAPWIL